MSRGFVYFIACPEAGRVKIGYTGKSPESRLRNLQTGSPTQLKLMCWQPGTRQDEQHLHDLLSPFRIHGEWFEAEDLVVYVMALVCENAIKAFEGAGLEPPQWALAGQRATGELVKEVRAYAATIQ
jgi:hypothetical protein